MQVLRQGSLVQYQLRNVWVWRALFLARSNVRGVSELTCVELFLRILKSFLAVSRYARMEVKANQDSTEREGNGGNSLSLGGAGSMCKVLVNSPRGKWHKESQSPLPCFFLDASGERGVVSFCEWPGGAKPLRHWSDLRGRVRGPCVSVEPWCVCVAGLACLAFSTGGRTSGIVRVPGPR